MTSSGNGSTSRTRGARADALPSAHAARRLVHRHHRPRRHPRPRAGHGRGSARWPSKPCNPRRSPPARTWSTRSPTSRATAIRICSWASTAPPTASTAMNVGCSPRSRPPPASPTPGRRGPRRSETTTPMAIPICCSASRPAPRVRCCGSIATMAGASPIRPRPPAWSSPPVRYASRHGWMRTATAMSISSSAFATGPTPSSAMTAAASAMWRRRSVSPTRVRPSARCGSMPTRTATSMSRWPTWTATPMVCS